MPALFNDFLDLISEFLIRGIFLSVLVVIAAQFFLEKKGVDVRYAQKILKWIILANAVATLLNIIFIFLVRDADLTRRMSGPYALIAFTLIVLYSLFPLLLLHRKLRHNVYFLLAVSILMNIGWLFESVAVHANDFHRDFAPEGYLYTPFDREIRILCRGFILGIAALVIGNIFRWLSRPKAQHS